MCAPIFGQLAQFACELLRMIDEGQTVSITDVCENIEHGTITQFIYTHCGFKNINVTLESIADVNEILAQKYVSENEAHKCGIDNNGLVFLVHLLVQDGAKLLYNMSFNDIDPESYRLD